MKKLILSLMIAVASVGAAQAQNYYWAVGLRMGGETGGLSAKHKIGPSSAVEGIASAYWKDGFMVTLLYERYIPVFGQGWNFFYGAGAHIGNFNKEFLLGIDGVLGVEYNFSRAPISVSLDWKPAFNCMKETDFWATDLALGVRVTF